MSAQPDVLRSLGDAVRQIRARIDRTLQRSGLRLGQYQVLRLLWDEDELTPREIADRLGVEMPTVTRTVQRMVRDALVERRKHPEDARSVFICLSARGRELRTPLVALIGEETEQVLLGFSAGERAAFVNMLERMAENSKT
jgi:MarR family transcriptional regulator, organic hydroperoxide resistance regulator